MVINLKNLVSPVIGLIFCLVSPVFADCTAQPLFDKSGSYQGCSLSLFGVSSFQAPSQIAKNRCLDFCTSEVKLNPLRNSSLEKSSSLEFGLNAQPTSCAVSSLKKGNSRFVQFEMSRPKLTPERRRELTQGQKPNAIIVSCSDSRVPPELVLDQGIGDLFVIRTAGHVLGSSAIASIEYAYQNLEAKTIIVMGHESCGAVKATLNHKQGSSLNSPSLNKMIETIQPHVKEFKDTADLDPRIEKPVRAHTEGTIRALMKKSEIIQKAVESHQIEVLAAFASISTGEVTFWEVDVVPEAEPKAIKKP
jgi:carbonic anhydrase